MYKTMVLSMELTLYLSVSARNSYQICFDSLENVDLLDRDISDGDHMSCGDEHEARLPYWPLDGPYCASRRFHQFLDFMHSVLGQ